MPCIVTVQFENKWNLAKKIGHSLFDKTERGSVGIAASLKRELEMVIRIIASRIGSEMASGSVFEALVNWQNHKFSDATEMTVIAQGG